MGIINMIFGPNLLYRLIAIVLSLTLHEFGHALAATLLGDKTPKEQGRLTLNPFAHLDPLGFILLIIAYFGWAKPVMTNPNRYRLSPRFGMIIVAIAGPFMNFILAMISIAILNALFLTAAPNNVLMTLFSMMASINISLMIFNLIPIPPLDGWNIIGNLLPRSVLRSSFIANYARFAPFFLFIFIIFPFSSQLIVSTISAVFGWMSSFL